MKEIWNDYCQYLSHNPVHFETPRLISSSNKISPKNEQNLFGIRIVVDQMVTIQYDPYWLNIVFNDVISKYLIEGHMQNHVQRTMDEFDMFFLIKIDEHTKSYHKNFLFKTQNDYKRGM